MKLDLSVNECTFKDYRETENMPDVFFYLVKYYIDVLCIIVANQLIIFQLHPTQLDGTIKNR